MMIDTSGLFQRLLERLPLSHMELIVLILTAPQRYKDHYIQKRNNRGKRRISQPTAEVKLVQKMLISTELQLLRVHESATAYTRGKSIVDHASPHAHNRYLLKLDFNDFFPSIDSAAIEHRVCMDSSFTESERRIILQILCRAERKSSTLKLSIGAPSSPFISNTVMWEFDCIIAQRGRELGVTYTRYADDMAFSTSYPRVLDKMHQCVLDALADLPYLNLTLNSKKTVNVSTKNRRQLVGLILGNNGTVSVGRSVKRLVRAELHRASMKDLSQAELNSLKGRLAFFYSVDPAFVSALCAKYGFISVKDIS